MLPALYHWSPEGRRAAIRGDGLRPFSEPVVQEGGHAFAYICLGTDPQNAWTLSGDMGWVKEVERWDLWQVRLADGDEVHYRSDFGPRLIEVRVFTPIPGERVWLVGSRDGEHPAAEPVKAAKAARRPAKRAVNPRSGT